MITKDIGRVKSFSKGKSQIIRKAHYVTSLTAFVLAFGILSVVLQFSSFATTLSGTVVGIGGKCLDNYNNLAENSNKIQLWGCLGNESQAWTVNGTTSTPGTIVNENGYCLDVADGSTTSGSDAILYQCNGTSSEQWYYNAESGEIINETSQLCLDDYHSGITDDNQIDVWDCNNTPAQKWDYEITMPAATPTPTTTPTPTVTPTTTTTATPKTPAIAVTNAFAPPTSATTLNQTSATDNSAPAATTKLNQTGTPSITSSTQPVAQKPVISNVTISKVTASSARLSWRSNVATGYTVKYGESPTNFTETDTFNATDTDIQIVLNKLPAGKHIYVAITPSDDKLTGSMKDVDFKTTNKSSSGVWILIVGILVFILVIIGMLIKLVGRKPVVPDHNNDLLPEPEMTPVVPQEDQATYNNRVNWWMPPNLRQTGLPKHDASEDYPDMFAEGRKRLDEEEKEYKLPKE